MRGGFRLHASSQMQWMVRPSHFGAGVYPFRMSCNITAMDILKFSACCFNKCKRGTSTSHCSALAISPQCPLQLVNSTSKLANLHDDCLWLPNPWIVLLARFILSICSQHPAQTGTCLVNPITVQLYVNPPLHDYHQCTQHAFQFDNVVYIIPCAALD